ncbi:MAG: cation diffusion facilitator family transporter [Erysipelotrichaceae bacterium]|nr:cation diffusion facilitator family transporter [Erysipelotrichaceae bacterium]MDY6035733.1 cation diffusion facilitator family transporter [Bulleidia sp.]
MKRNQEIIRTSILGIVVNLLLAAFKAVIGLLSGSIAIVLDAVNNVSDAFSSIITIVGTKLAGRKPDHKHPFGYGRIEYLSALVISLIIMYAGITSLIEAVKSILNPSTPSYTVVGLIIIFVAVLAKFFMGMYVKKTGERLNSGSLIASGEDSRMDSIISASTLVAAILFLTLHINIEAYLAVVISIMIIKAGYEIVASTISTILGERADGGVSAHIKRIVMEFEGVHGVYDLFLNNYGPNTMNGSLHIEVDDNMTAWQIDKLERKIADRVYQEAHVAITGISVYTYNTKDDEAKRIFKDIRKIVMSYDHVMQMHGFFMNGNDISFDIVIDFQCGDRNALYHEIVDHVRKQYPTYHFITTLDSDISD